MRYKRITVLAAILLSGCTANYDCADHYVERESPALTNDKLKAKTQAVCFADYAVLHSGITRTPLWAAEHLTKKGLAKDIERADNFYPEPSLPVEHRAELADYAKSGYDRGHLAPAADMTTDQAMHESFSLANMTPQVPANNRGLWSSIEEKTRALATQRGELYVVSGAIFAGAAVKRINKRVFIPTSYFKAMYDPKTGESGAYLVPNDASNDYKTVSIDELVKVASIDPFPSIGAASKKKRMALPTVGEK